MSNIIKLEASNIKRLRAVRITPHDSTVIVGGDNAQGKSSVLDAIEMAFGGKKTVPDRPIRDGESKAHVVCELDDLVVKRTFHHSKDGGVKSTLKVESKEGAVFKSPQGMLDKLVGELSFDPLAFCRLDSKAQLETLRKLVGVDVSTLDEKRSRRYQERTDVNRELSSKKAQLSSMVFYKGVPTQEQSMSDVVGELNAATEVVRIHDRHQSSLQLLDEKLSALEIKLKDIEEQILETKQERVALINKIQSFDAPDLEEIRERMSTLEETNRKARENQSYLDMTEKVGALQTKSDELTETIQAIDDEKRRALESVEFPVEGLSFDETGVLFGGVPFSQASSAEQLKVSVAMGLAMNPELKVILIRDGSLLDQDSLGTIKGMASSCGAQIWIERVSKGDEVNVIIEDGEVQQTCESIEDLWG